MLVSKCTVSTTISRVGLVRCQLTGSLVLVHSHFRLANCLVMLLGILVNLVDDVALGGLSVYSVTGLPWPSWSLLIYCPSEDWRWHAYMSGMHTALGCASFLHCAGEPSGLRPAPLALLSAQTAFLYRPNSTINSVPDCNSFMEQSVYRWKSACYHP